MLTPTRGADTSETALHIEFSELTDTETGGSPILSYIVAWDEGNSTGEFVNVIGDFGVEGGEANLETSVLIEEGVVSGATYRIKVYTKNIYGDGAESEELSIVAETVVVEVVEEEETVVSE
jgi:hypothetical protein